MKCENIIKQIKKESDYFPERARINTTFLF